MLLAVEMLKPTEAAVVARVSVRDVNRVIDEHILPDSMVSLEDGRRVLGAACSLIIFYFDSADRLTADERRFAIHEAGTLLRPTRLRNWRKLIAADWTIRHEFLTVDLSSFVRRTDEGLDRLAAARSIIVSDPGISGGSPVIKGTRIPVHDVAASVAAGVSVDRLLKAYPTLDAEKIELASVYAAAYPFRGRPRGGALPEGAVIVSDQRVPRLRKAG